MISDSMASDAYNLILSQNRVESAVHYIVSKGSTRHGYQPKGAEKRSL